MNRETVDEFTRNLVKVAGIVLDRFQSGHHPSESQLKRLEGALFPFVGEKLCGHKIVEECECELNGAAQADRTLKLDNEPRKGETTE